MHSNGSAVLEIEDTGIGIAADEQKHLFDRFFRTRAAGEQAIQGTGLGSRSLKRSRRPTVGSSRSRAKSTSDDVPRRVSGNSRLGERAPHLRAERRRATVGVDVYGGMAAADADLAVGPADLPAVRDRARADAFHAKLDLELVVEAQDGKVLGFDARLG